MGWGGYASAAGGGSSSKNGWVEEGNVELFVFGTEPVRCRFLTEDLSPEDVMYERKCTREEADDYIFTKASQERWLMPKAAWEHNIKEIPGKRYFSTAFCRGKSSCLMCDENAKAKENGVSENKMLPYPVRKRFIVPAYFYAMKRVLYVRCSDEFFDSVADYVNKHGSAVDFDIFKVGKSFDTKYKAVYVGESQKVEPAPVAPVLPKDLNLLCSESELKRRLEGGRRVDEPSKVQQAPAQAAAQTVAPVQAGTDFKLPFGTHKGKTFAQLVAEGNSEYIEFLAKNSAGAVQAEAAKFLGAK